MIERPTAAVMRLTLNQPQSFNALSADLMTQLLAALNAADSDEAVRVVVIAAKGKAFCAGHDLKQMMADNALALHRALFAQCSRLMLRITAIAVPVIAVVDGMATAAGCQLVAQCDLAIASDQARFAVSGVNLGLFCATPAVALSRNLPRKAAFEMLVTGEFVDAHTAMKQGLVNRVVATGELEAELSTLCAQIMSKPRETVAMGKALFYQQLEMGAAPAYQLAGETMACNMMHASAQEGVAAFVEKRPPNWGGLT